MKRINWQPHPTLPVALLGDGFIDGTPTRLQWIITSDRPTGSSVYFWSAAGDGSIVAGGASLKDCIDAAEAYEERTEVAGVGACEMTLQAAIDQPPPGVAGQDTTGVEE